MDNSRFSSLIYRIIGKPERWHDDYIDVMHQVLDETESFDDPENFSELAIGDQILSRISNTNEALNAFGTLLDKSRFRMIVLDEAFVPIYHNQHAEELFHFVQSKNKPGTVALPIVDKLRKAALYNANSANGTESHLSSINSVDQNGDQLYLRSIHNQSEVDGTVSTYYLLLVLDKSAATEQLNPDLVDRYELTDKEQMVLIKLIHGKTIKQIASDSFVTENTVKTHLKALFRKTDTKSQTDIVRLILTHESQIFDTYFGTSGGVLPPQKQPPSSDKFVTLTCGQEIAYREYGPADGSPIIVCHNGYGCRVTIPRDYEKTCKKYGKRVIIPDRPGYGLSPYLKGHPQGWNKMFMDFIDQLNIESYELLGTVLGSVIALNFAASADKRLTRVKLCSPVFVNERKDTDYLIGIFAPVTRLIRASERFACEIYELWLKSVTMNLSVHYRSMLDNSVGTAERDLFQNNNTIDLMIEGFQLGSSHGLEGISHEMVYCLSPRNVDLSKVAAPVDLWWGTEDNRISREGVDNLAKQLPNAKVHVREGYSEHIYYALFDEIVSK